MAARIPAVWGIDLGQCALKAIRLEMKEGLVVATAFEYIEHPKILSQPDADPDELAREALSQFLSRNKIKGSLVSISVPGQSGLARFVKLPPVDEKKISDIVKFEAKQQIPFPLEEVVWDFQRLNKGDIIDGLALETEIGLFAMKRDMVMRAIRQFKEVNVEVHLVQMAPLALCNFISYDLLGKGADLLGDDGDDANACIVALEIGTDNSNLVITNGGRIIWQRPIPIGGNHFTRALTKEMKLTFAKAEHLKKNAAKSPELKKILTSLRQVLNDFVGEVQRSLGYFTNTHRNAQIQFMVGLGNAFRLPGLQKFLQEKLQLEVRKLAKFERAGGETVTTAPTFKENITSFGVAYGLALQGIKEARLQTNLLPYEVRLERVIRGKKPWAVAAAACLLMGMFLLAFARGMEKNAVTDPVVQERTKKLKDQIEAEKRARGEFDAEEDKLKKRIKSLDEMGGGVKERPNWQLLHQYVNMSTPQPDGTRLPINWALEQPWEKYWNSDKEAQKAFTLFQAKRFGGVKDVPPDQVAANDRKIKRNLIQVNIAGINALYSDDLLPYFVKIAKDHATLPGMTDADKKNVLDYVANAEDDARQKALPRAGWVVEIRGYTYHKDGAKFVNNTIVANLSKPTFLENHPAYKELNQRIQSYVNFLHLYENEVVRNPVAGKFNVINKSYLKTLVKGEAGGGDKDKGKGKGGGPEAGPGAGALQGGFGGGGIDGGKGGGDKDDGKKVNREGWRPIGDVASLIFGDFGRAGGAGGGAGGGGGGPGVGQEAGKFPGGGDKGFGKGVPENPGGDKGNPKGPDPGGAVPRTEFVILLIWREPIASQREIDLGGKK